MVNLLKNICPLPTFIFENLTRLVEVGENFRKKWAFGQKKWAFGHFWPIKVGRKTIGFNIYFIGFNIYFWPFLGYF